MIAPWITIPVKDIHLDLPMSMADDSIKIMFRNVEAIDETIKKLEDLKTRMPDKEILAHV